MLTKEFQDAKKSRFAQNSTETMPFRKIRINKSGKYSLFYSAIDLSQKSIYHPKLYFVSLPFRYWKKILFWKVLTGFLIFQSTKKKCPLLLSTINRNYFKESLPVIFGLLFFCVIRNSSRRHRYDIFYKD